MDAIAASLIALYLPHSSYQPLRNTTRSTRSSKWKRPLVPSGYAQSYEALLRVQIPPPDEGPFSPISCHVFQKNGWHGHEIMAIKIRSPGGCLYAVMPSTILYLIVSLARLAHGAFPMPADQKAFEPGDAVPTGLGQLHIKPLDWYAENGRFYIDASIVEGFQGCLRPSGSWGTQPAECGLFLAVPTGKLSCVRFGLPCLLHFFAVGTCGRARHSASSKKSSLARSYSSHPPVFPRHLAVYRRLIACFVGARTRQSLLLTSRL